MKGRPIRQAYTDTGAWDVSCPNCGAAPGQWCATDEDRPRRVPCVARVCAGGVLPAAADKYGHDFSEPRAQSTAATTPTEGIAP